jgi:hypothetical protein
MKSIIALFPFATLLFSCKTESAKLPPNKVPGNNFLSSQYFILEYGEKNQGKKDSLFINCIGQDAFLIWKKDTIAKEWSYENSTGFISSLGPLSCKNTFLMQVYEGDGCPSQYKILAFKDSANYFLSPAFGNCETVSSIKIGWPEITFEFSEFKEAERKHVIYVYDQKLFTVIEKK